MNNKERFNKEADARMKAKNVNDGLETACVVIGAAVILCAMYLLDKFLP